MLSRHGLESVPCLADGWQLSHLCGPSPLCGSNGMRFGEQGRLYVAQAYGDQISTLDLQTGKTEVVPTVDREFYSPDDLAFDSLGTMYVTEVFAGRVSARASDGQLRTVTNDLPAVNGITVYQDRLFVNECRLGGRLLELFPDGRPARLLADNLQMPNAMMVGPDQKLYFPEVATGEIWRCDLQGGTPERFLDGLAMPTAVKFDEKVRLITTQMGSGEVTQVDIQTGARTTLTNVRVGIDNLVFDQDQRLYLSNMLDGGVSEILSDGREREILGPGLVGPFGICADGNQVLIADGFSLGSIKPDGSVDRIIHFARPGYPGFIRDVAADSENGAYVTVSAGNVVFCDLRSGDTTIVAEGLEELNGITRGLNGQIYVAEGGTGRLLQIDLNGKVSTMAKGLGHPTGVAVASDGSCFVSDRDGGRVLHADDDVDTVIDGLGSPQGLAIGNDHLFVVDALRKELIAVSLSNHKKSIIATELPVGQPIGVGEKSFPGFPVIFPGPLATFTGLSVSPAGGIYLSGDANGGVLVLRQTSQV